MRSKIHKHKFSASLKEREKFDINTKSKTMTDQNFSEPEMDLTTLLLLNRLDNAEENKDEIIKLMMSFKDTRNAKKAQDIIPMLERTLKMLEGFIQESEGMSEDDIIQIDGENWPIDKTVVVSVKTLDGNIKDKFSRYERQIICDGQGNLHRKEKYEWVDIDPLTETVVAFRHIYPSKN